jgi:broad specificity phosphatase PhoE
MDRERLPMLNRLQWIVASVLAFVLILLWFRCALWPVPITSVFLVRHGEKADASADPPLSVQGLARAVTLAHVLGDAGISVIFVTTFQRTQQTAAPLAATLGLTPVQYQANDAQAVASTILADHVGSHVLVVAHSNTVDDIAAAFGALGVAELGEQQFDRLFVISRFHDTADLERLRYGDETP